MHKCLPCFVLIVTAANAHAQSMAPDAFEQLKSLAGEWHAQLPGFGTISSSIRLVSNGQAIEETIGTPTDNEVSVYTRDDRRILLTHFCSMTPGGHQARLETAVLFRAPRLLQFVLRDTVNLSNASAPHMRRVDTAFIDTDHYTEVWTKTAHGKDTELKLEFVRTAP